MTAKKKTNSNLPARRDYGADSKSGWEGTDNSDFQMPFINQLQALSPEICGDKDQKIKGAEIGMWINSVSKKLYSEVYLVPCMTKHSFVEWRSRDSGGGFVGEHPTNSPIVEDAKASAAGDITKLKTETGNDLIDTFSIYALVLDKPTDEEPSELAVVSFTKTKAKRYREIMTRLRTCKDAKDAPLFAHRLVMRPTPEKNPAGQPYQNVRISPAINDDVLASMIEPGNAILATARALKDSVVSGAAKANFDSVEQEGPAPTGDKHF